MESAIVAGIDFEAAKMLRQVAFMAPNIWKNVAAREVAQVAGKTQSEADAVEL
ncbi:MAG: hypothetical protein ABJF89_13540 [Parasphingorhabdus sp.]|uniref:hypothetical protein n=1 Tax=Parasphingorhabdus sp. TaxID=2709688 RepID=UPI003265531E